MGLANAQWLAGNGAASRSADGRIALFGVPDKSFGFGTTFIWDRRVDQARRLPGECDARILPAYALSGDGNRIVVVCSQGLGYSIRVWDLDWGKETPSGMRTSALLGAPRSFVVKALLAGFSARS